MENVLEVYKRPHCDTHPLVCLDEANKQLVKETRVPLPMKPGEAERYDYEYERNGTSNLFMMFAPLEAWRQVKVTDRRTKLDWAHCVKDLVDVHFPKATTITLVQDNLNTHKPASLYEAFAPQEARRLLDKLEFAYTPKHGSWLNMRAGPGGAVLPKTAEIELSVLVKQCLDRRIPDQATLTKETTAWQQARNQQAATVNWRFTTKDARIKLAKLYPST